MNKTGKWRKILAIMLTLVMMLQNAQTIAVSAGVSTAEIDARVNGQKTETASQPSQSQVDERANGNQYKAQQKQQQTQQTEQTQQSAAQEAVTGNSEPVDIADYIGGADGTSGNDTTVVSNANVSATVTQTVFQQEIDGAVYNFAQMTAEIKNNDAENNATGVSLKVLLPSQLTWVSGYGVTTDGMLGYNNPSEAQANGNDLSDIPQDVLSAYAGNTIIMWTNQTIGAGQTATYNFAVQIENGLTDLSGVDSAWFVNGTACVYDWMNAEVLAPEPTEEPAEEPTPEVTEEAAEEPTPEITEEPEAEIEEVPEETPAAEETIAPEEDANADSAAAVAILENDDNQVAVMDGEEGGDGEGSDPVPEPYVKNKNISSYDKDHLTFSYQINGNDYVDGEIPRDATIIKILVKYTFDDKDRPTKDDYEGYTYTLPDLPSWLKLKTNPSGPIKDPNTNTAGSYVINEENGKKVVHFTYLPDYVDGKTGIVGTFWLNAQIDKEGSSHDESFTLNLGNVTKTFKFEDSGLEGQKSYVVDTDGNLLFKIVLTAQDADISNVKIQDNLTGKLTFIHDSLRAVDSDNQDVRCRWDVVDNTSQKAEIIVDRVVYGKPVTVYYKVAPNGNPDGTGSDGNSATWNWGDNKSGSDTVPVNMDNHKINKTSERDEANNTIKYTIKINEFAANLIPDGEGENPSDQKITLEDTLSDKVSLDTSTIKIIDARNNTNLLDSSLPDKQRASYNYDGKSLTVTVPDATYVKLTYDVLVLGNVGSTVEVTNTAKLTGTINKSSTTKDDMIIQDSGATIRGQAGTVTFNKTGKYTVNGKIPNLTGVVFGLYSLSLENKQIDGTPHFDATSQGGTVKFGSDTDANQKLSVDTLYYVQEKSTIDGYVLDSTKHYFVMFNPDETDEHKQNIQNTVKQLYGNIEVKYIVDGGSLGTISNDTIPAETSDSFSVTKKLDGQNVGETSDFQFNMKLVSYNPSGSYNKPAWNETGSTGDSTDNKAFAFAVSDSGEITRYNQTVSVNGQSKAAFNNIKFIYEGTYKFAISEIARTNTVYVYDRKTYEVTVVVTRDTDGNLKVESKSSNADTINSMTFNNYTSMSLYLKKQISTEATFTTDQTFEFFLTGTWSDNTAFNFNGVKVNGTQVSQENSGAKVTVTVPARATDGSVTLTGIPKGVSIKVKENLSNTQQSQGWSYKQTTVSGTDTVFNNDNATVEVNEDNKTVTVLNEYKEKGSVTFAVNKKYNDWRDGQEFNFTIEGLAAPQGVTTIPMPSSPSVTVKNTSSGSGEYRNETFGSVEYTVNGDYYYKIKEVIPDEATNNQLNGVKYDPLVTYIKVHVENGAGGAKTITLFTSGKVQENDSLYQTLTTQQITGTNNTVTAEFENTYEASTNVAFSGTKVLTGRALTASDKFTFNVFDVTNRQKQLVSTGTNDSAGIITFTPISYTAAQMAGETEKTFSYEIEEADIPSTIPGVTKDSSVYRFQVKVVKSSEGSLSASVVGAGNPVNGVYVLPNPSGKNATFVNTYGASASVVLTATKSITNRSLQENEFTFKITGDGLGQDGITAQNDANGNITFPAISYDLGSLDGAASKEFTYTVEEVANGKGGVTYDGTRYTVTVKVTDNGTGALTTEVTGATKVANTDNHYAITLSGNKQKNFENQYDAQTTIQFTGIKALLNKTLTNGEFHFTISGPKIGNGTSVTVSNQANGTIEFPEISYGLDDLLKSNNDYTSNSFTYTIEEVNKGQTINGVKYDNHVYTVTVMVTNNTQTGQLDTTVKLGDRVINQSVDATTGKKTYALTGNTATFTNTYGANTSVTFTGTKVLKNKALSQGDFTFVIEGTGNTSSYNETATNNADGNIVFSPISYNLTDLDQSGNDYTSKTFTYEIKEVKPQDNAIPGVDYSSQVYYAKVTVTNEGSGNLSKTVEIGTEKNANGEINYRKVTPDANGNYSITPTGTATFTNTYNASTTVQFKGTKKLIQKVDPKDSDEAGKDRAFAADDFEFKITGPNLVDASGNPVNYVIVKNKANGEFEFPVINYQVTDLNKDAYGNYTSKEFNYTIEEVDNKKGGITYDTTKYHVTVTITNNNGQLDQTVTVKVNDADTGVNVSNGTHVYTLNPGNNEPSFTNIYSATGSYTFKVQKQLAGREFKIGDNFKFQILKEREVFNTKTLTVTNQSDIKDTLELSFEEDHYTLNDVGKTYQYTIQELKPDTKMDGVTISDQIYIVDVTISDNGDGTLKAEPKWIRTIHNHVESVDFDHALFINTYEADGEIQLVAEKVLRPLSIDGKTFNFSVYETDENGNIASDANPVRTAVNNGDSIIFDAIQYTQADVNETYWYAVKEEIPADDQKPSYYTYDQTLYKVKVEVSIDAEDGDKLVAKKTIYDQSGKETDAMVFTNTYEANGSIVLNGKKVLTGAEILPEGAFKFVVKEGDTKVAEGTNAADGSITFSEIKYEYNKDSNPLGEHIYTITEVLVEADGYVYDATSRTVVVKVTDDEQGHLTAVILPELENDPSVKSDVTTTETTDGKTTVINSFENKKIELKFRKTNEKDENLTGAVLTLSEYDLKEKKKGTVVDTWTTDENDHVVSDGLVAGKSYILEETTVPGGYAKAVPIIFTINTDIERTVTIVEGGLMTDGIIVMKDQKTGVQILKVDESGNAVSGAKLTILDAEGKTVLDAEGKEITWETDGTAHVVEGLVAGQTYTLRELQAPDGYLVAKDVTFTVRDNEVIQVTMTDIKTKVSILKVDGNGKALPGATLEIRDGEKVIEKWVSDDKAHVLEGKLVEGKEYTLWEVTAPDGYTLAEPQKFTVDASKDVTEVTMKNTTNSVVISKKELTGSKSIGGAVLRVVDSLGNIIIPQWTTEENKDKVVTGELKPNVPYILEEVTPPTGYAKADNITFILDEAGQVYVNSTKVDSVVMRDAKLGLRVSKSDITGNNELPGATLQLIHKKTSTVIDEWTTTGTPHYVTDKLIAGDVYILHEKTAPAGYAYAADVEFTLYNDSVEGKEQHVTMYDAPNTVVITKTDLVGTKELAGAKLQILDANGNILESWTSSTEEHKVTASLKAGEKYILHEVEAPDGYLVAEDITFTVNKDGSTTRVTMKDAATSVKVSKTDITGEKEIAGAQLQILDADGNIVEKWISDGTTYVVDSKLAAGAVYTLHEVSAPAGYRVAEDVKFTVDKDGKTTTVTMKDAPTKASILKTDESGKGLAGASLAVKDSTGKVLEQWVSDGTAHVIEGLLTVGETYTLTEISAPSGYTLAQDITFTMEDEDVVEVSMKDYQDAGTGQITVTKKTYITDGGMSLNEIIPGNKGDTFYVNLFTDENGQYPFRTSTPKAIVLKDSYAGTVVFDDLPTGTYYVFETDENGNALEMNSIYQHKNADFMCMVESGSSNEVALDLKAGDVEGYVNLNNIFYDIPDGYSYDAWISISKQVLRGDSQTTVDDTFYAGIFTKDETDGSYNLFKVVELVQNDTVTVEVPLGGENGENPITYYVLETDADGNIIDLDEFAYEVSGEGSVSLDVDHTKGSIAIVNTLLEEKEGKLRVHKVDENGVGLAGASFRLTDEDGEVVDEWTSQVSAHELSLEPGVYVLTEVQAPTGYTGSGSITITVDDDYNISMEGAIDYSYNDDLLDIVNKPVEVTPTPSATPTPDASVTPQPGGSTGGGSTGGGSSSGGTLSGSSANTYNTLSGKVAVKTGDDTPIALYVVLMVVAAALSGGVVYRKRRKNSK